MDFRAEGSPERTLLPTDLGGIYPLCTKTIRLDRLSACRAMERPCHGEQADGSDHSLRPYPDRLLAATTLGKGFVAATTHGKGTPLCHVVLRCSDHRARSRRSERGDHGSPTMALASG